MNFARESIFVSALRSFCTSFATIIGLLIGLLLVVMGFMVLSGPNYLPEKSQPMIMPDAQGKRELLSGHTPAVLRLDFQGVIGMGSLTAEKVQNLLLDSRQDLLAGSRVKAVLLYIDTPGGTVTDADSIYRALLDYKTKYNVPIYAFVDGLCASGGMYIASAADKTYATEPSTIGSVGVIMGPAFNFSDAMTKIGVSALTITEGKNKDMLNPFRPWKPDEDASIRNIISCLYDKFVAVVTSARPRLSKEKLVQDYGAQVYVAAQAQELGYIDVAGSNYAAALTDLTTVAGIDSKEPYQVIQLTPPQPFFGELTQAVFKPSKVVHTLDFGPLASPELSGKPLYFYSP